MGTLSARNLTQALSQARNVGIVEEPFVVDDVSVVVRNLRPDQYDSIFKECQGLADVEYLNAWQMAHVSRAICEINGLDFRDVTTVEVEEPDPKRPNQTRTVKVELHSWLQKNLLAGWTREVIYICYRKVSDVIEAGEKKAQEGITFRVADETNEDKYRRLLGELKELEEDLPEKMVDNILRDNGLSRRSTANELEAVQTRLSNLSKEQEPVQEQEPVVVQTEPPVQTIPEVPPPTSTPPSADRIAELLRNRTPLNQPVNPIVREPEQEPVVQAPRRTAELASIEGDVTVTSRPIDAVNLQPQDQRPEIVLGSRPRLDLAEAQKNLDKPPTGGINPRFRPPNL